MDEQIDAILALLQTAMSSRITTFYKGEVEIIAKNYLPALMVYGLTSGVQYKDTCRDTYANQIGIKVVVNVMKYADEGGTNDVMDAQEDLYQIVGELENGVFKSDTVLAVLRGNADVFKLTENVEVSYSAARVGEFFYNYAIITVTLTDQLVERP